MSDAQPNALERAHRAAPAQEGAVAAGAMLRRAREAAGVHLASLATSLKIPAGRLEALETGRIDLLPDPVFARALAASVCRSLRIDPEPVLRQLPHTAASPADDSAAANSKAPFKPSAKAAGRSRSGGLSRPIAVAVLLLLLATVALIFAPDFGWELPGGIGRSSGTATSGTAASVTGSRALGNEPLTTGNALSRPAPPKPVVLPATPVQEPATRASAPVVAAAGATALAASASTTPEPAVSTADTTVVFETKTAAWIQVIDAKGNALIRKTVPAGQTVRVASAELPLKVTVGHPDKTKVTVRGAPFDVESQNKGGVARFQIN